MDLFSVYMLVIFLASTTLFHFYLIHLFDSWALIYSSLWFTLFTHLYTVNFCSHCTHFFCFAFIKSLSLFQLKFLYFMFLSLFFMWIALFCVPLVLLLLLLLLLHMRVFSEYQTCIVSLFNCHHWHALMHLMQYILINVMYS